MIRGMARAAWRLFFVQGSWNYERMLGMGMGHVVEPMLRHLAGGRDSALYREAMGRAAGYFNAHPDFAGFAAGAIVRSELDGQATEVIERLRTTLPAPLGSIGDRLVWAGALPAAVGAGLALAATAPVGAGAVALLLLYNIVHIPMRVYGLFAGLRLGVGVAQSLGAPWLKAGLRIVGPAAAALLGFALPVVGAWLVEPLSHATRVGVAVAFLAGFISLRWLLPQLGAARLGIVAAAVTGIAGWIL